LSGRNRRGEEWNGMEQRRQFRIEGDKRFIETVPAPSIGVRGQNQFDSAPNDTTSPGFRFGGRERDPLHIPFALKEAYQRRRRDVSEPKRGERLLRQIAQDSCHQGE